MSAETAPDALLALLQRDPARPLITFLGADGARTELSVRTFENNVAKAANLLRDDADLQPGGLVALELPLHWQTSVWLGACAAVGGVARIGGGTGGADVAVLAPGTLAAAPAPLTLATALHPLGMPFPHALPAGVLDAAVEVRAHGDRFVPAHHVQPDDPWLDVGGEVLRHSEALDGARALAVSIGLPEGGRALCRRPLDDVRAALALLALPLAMDAAVVLLADDGADLEDVRARERCDAVLA